METNEEYVCGLDEQSQEKARKELNEDPKERLGAVQTLKEWIRQQNWIRSPTGKIKYCFAIDLH